MVIASIKQFGIEDLVDLVQQVLNSIKWYQMWGCKY